MEPNDIQNSSKKVKNISTQSLEIASKFLSIFRIPSFREGLLITLCFGLLMSLLQIKLFSRTLDFKVGQASKYDIRAPRDVVDREATRVAQQEAVENAMNLAKENLEYYRIDETISKTVTYKLNRFFELFDKEREAMTPEQIKNLTRDNFEVLKYQSYFYVTPKIDLLKSLLELEADQYRELKEKSYQLLINIEQNQRIHLKNIKDVTSKLPEFIAEFQVSETLQPVMEQLLQTALRPNLIIDEAKLARLKNQVISEVPQVIYRENDLIIAKNQVITENDIKMLHELHLVVDESSQLKVFLSLSFIVLLMIGLGLIYIFQFHPELFKQERMLYLLLLLLLLVLGMVKVFSLVETSSLPYLAPVSFAIMLITILINPQLALVMSMVISVLGGIIVEYNLALTIYYFVSGMITVLSVSRFQRQRDLVRCGSILMISNAVVVIFLNLLFRASFDIWAVLLAIFNGFFSAVLAIGSLPFLENIFKITSPIRLLELSNPGHPLLRRLQIEAPGTYHHSIMVGNLAEAAAQVIGADALWVRVGSYYHDIGKIKRPYFFVENQFALENPHEKLNPSLSTLIITYHVKEGAEIAREHGLPEKLIEIIEQHHGTDLVRYFYNKANEANPEDRGAINEKDFRYEGPKPQTKEAALVMMADSVEAAVKSMSKLTPAKLEALVHKIIWDRLEDGQFDECNLTLKDLTEVKNSFLKVLGGLFHTRVEYPEKVLKEMERKKTNGSIAK